LSNVGVKAIGYGLNGTFWCYSGCPIVLVILISPSAVWKWRVQI